MRITRSMTTLPRPYLPRAHPPSATRHITTHDDTPPAIFAFSPPTHPARTRDPKQQRSLNSPDLPRLNTLIAKLPASRLLHHYQTTTLTLDQWKTKSTKHWPCSTNPRVNFSTTANSCGTLSTKATGPYLQQTKFGRLFTRRRAAGSRALTPFVSYASPTFPRTAGKTPHMAASLCNARPEKLRPIAPASLAISTPGAKFMTMDISNFYLMTPSAARIPPPNSATFPPKSSESTALDLLC
eukprot:CCRYP_008412-RA/>CCRYP_008412-RA protein AED:0.59 eAED:0.87 QI:0/0/0/1/0/0/2/0/239